MLQAVVGFSGKQFRVTNNSRLSIDRVDCEVGAVIHPVKVYMTVDDAGVVDTAPSVSITACVIGHQNAPEKLVFKKHRRKGYERKRGCRQPMTQIQIKIEGEKA